MMNPLIKNNLEAIRALAREYGVVRLEVFGSVCTPNWDPATSDIDFLVEYSPGYDFGPWGKRRHELRRSLEGLMGLTVDLISMTTLENRWMNREAAKTRQIVFVREERMDKT